MIAFDNAIKRVDEIEMPDDLKPVFISAMRKLSFTLDSMEGLNVDFEKLFEAKLYNNLRIVKYSEDMDFLESGSEGCYIHSENCIYLRHQDEQTLMHEFIHFILHNLYSRCIPTWADEALTQRLTNLVRGTPRATAYRPLLDLTQFIERNVGESMSLVAFLNGEIDAYIKRHNIDQFQDDLNHFAKNYAKDSARAARSKIVAHYYDLYICKQLFERDTKFEDIMYKLAEFEARDIRNGEINPFTTDTVSGWLKAEDREEIFNGSNFFKSTFFQKLIFSKGVRAGLAEDKKVICEQLIQDYLSYLRKKIWEQHGGSQRYTDSELRSVQKLPKIKKMLNDVCKEAIKEKNEQQEQQAMEDFWESCGQSWLGRDDEQFQTNIEYINGFSKLFASSMYLAGSVKSPIVGNSYWSQPLFKKEDRASLTRKLDKVTVENLQEITKSLTHGDQCNIVIELNGEMVPIGNVMLIGGRTGLFINWKGVWGYLPKDVQMQIKNTIVDQMDDKIHDCII